MKTKPGCAHASVRTLDPRSRSRRSGTFVERKSAEAAPRREPHESFGRARRSEKHRPTLLGGHLAERSAAPRLPCVSAGRDRYRDALLAWQRLVRAAEFASNIARRTVRNP